MTVWIVLAVLAVAIFAMRASVVFLVGRATIPAGVERLLHLAPAALIAALVATTTLALHGSFGSASIAETLPRVLAVGAGGALALRGAHPLVAITAALPAFWLATAVVG